jgi:hypothetical protein
VEVLTKTEEAFQGGGQRFTVPLLEQFMGLSGRMEGGLVGERGQRCLFRPASRGPETRIIASNYAIIRIARHV